MGNKTLSIDFGGTRIKAGIVSSGEVIDSFTLDTPQNSKLAHQLPMVKQALLERPENIRKDITALVCALPAIVDTSTCKVTRVFGKYEDSLDFPIEQWVKEEMGLPVMIENDARAAAIGEWQQGAGQDSDHMVMVTLGTGIGTAVISDKTPLRGNLGVAGNLGGHSILVPDGRACSCGMQGCIEAYVASWALDGIAKESEKYAQSTLSACSTIRYHAVFEQAALGDALAIELRERAYRYWSLLLINLIHQYDPETIVIGGGIMAGKDIILPELTKRVHAQLDPMHQHIQLRATSLDDNAALIGLDFLWHSAS